MAIATTFQADRRSWKLLLWTAVAGLVFGLIGFGEIAEDVLRSARNSVHKHPASGDIVIAAIDDKSLKEFGRWPWPRSKHARLTDALTEAGANRIFFDLVFHGPTVPREDQALAASIKRSGRVYLPVRHRSGIDQGMQLNTSSMPLFTEHAKLGSISVRYNYQNAVWRLPVAVKLGTTLTPSYASQLANFSPLSEEFFIPDYSIDPASVPIYSASDLLARRVPTSALKGKDFVVAVTTEAVGDQYFIPGTGKLGGAYVQIIGAETLKKGLPLYLGWIPGLLLALSAAALALIRRRNGERLAILLGAASLLLFGPILLESELVFIDVTPGLFVVLVVGSVLLWHRLVARGLVNPISNLPNLNALRAAQISRDRALIASKILNFEEILATLPPDSERLLVEQIVARLKVGDDDRIIYQGDGGIFAWFAPSATAFGNHLEALAALFRTPARIGRMAVDLSVSFGVEIGSGRSLASRLASALVAADDAARDGLKWRFHDPETLESASWRLSMLSQLDQAIDAGEVWVAYQPKLDLATRRIIGAEALARWTHPEKGPIAASEFVAAAEQNNRIGKLTDFVLEQAVACTGPLVRKAGGHFEMAVNMSASLLSDKQFVLRLSAMLARHGLEPRHLILELTETAALVSSGEGLEMLGRLRDLGIGISIDDYGTGLSTLDYLKRVPASEIKIDQSFVKGITESRSDRLMVQSTIQLAQSLGLRVVAEGAEQREIVDVLTEMGCDVAQGYAIGRPMSVDSLTKRIIADRKRTAA